MREPDFNNVLAVLDRGRPARPTLFEFFMDMSVYERLLNEKRPDRYQDELPFTVRAFAAAGYDYATFRGSNFDFPAGNRNRIESCSLNDGSAIKDKESFDSYSWPEVNNFDYSPLAEASEYLPQGMKLIVDGPGGMLESLIKLSGYDNLCMMLYENEELLSDIAYEVGKRIEEHYRTVLTFKSVGAIISSDDWGFKTQTMISPVDLRKYIFPCHKKIVELAHEAGRPAILHSCGQLNAVMDDVIDDMGFDAKHSYEDAILPVEEAYEKYHRRIAVLGGIDVDFVCRSTADDIYKRSIGMLVRSSGRGAYALGSGNSIPGYVPPENYFAMLQAATG